MTPDQEARFELAWESQTRDAELRILRGLELELPEDVEIQRRVGVCLSGLGKLDEARRVLVAAQAREPDGWTSVYLGNLEWRADNLAAAEFHFRRAMREMPELAVPIWCLADLQVALDKPQEAEALFRSAIRIDQRDPAAHAALGRFLLRRGVRDEGAAEVLAALTLDPANKVAVSMVKQFKLETPPLNAQRSQSDGEFRPTPTRSAKELRLAAEALRRKAIILSQLSCHADSGSPDKRRNDDPRWLKRKSLDADARARKKERALEHKERQQNKG